MKQIVALLLNLVIGGTFAQNLSIRGHLNKPPNGLFYIEAQIPEEGDYLVQRSTIAATNGWTTITNFTAQPGTTTAQEMMRGTSRFYRLARMTNRPAITLQPVGITNYTPVEVKLRASATGSAPLRVRWYRDGRAIDGAISTNLFFTGRADLSGNYYLVVTNPWGSVTSSVAAVKITAAVAPTIAGKTIRFVVGSAQGNFPATGNFTTVFNSSGFYTTTGSSIFLNDSGTWLYGIESESTALIAVPGSIAYTDGLFTLGFKTPTEGSYHLAAPGKNGFQTGTFEFLN